jgi:hypothetical protein
MGKTYRREASKYDGEMSDHKSKVAKLAALEREYWLPDDEEDEEFFDDRPYSGADIHSLDSSDSVYDDRHTIITFDDKVRLNSIYGPLGA